MALFVPSATDRLTRMIQSAAGAGAPWRSRSDSADPARLNTLHARPSSIRANRSDPRDRRAVPVRKPRTGGRIGDPVKCPTRSDVFRASVNRSQHRPTTRKLVARLGASADASPPAGFDPKRFRLLRPRRDHNPGGSSVQSVAQSGYTSRGSGFFDCANGSPTAERGPDHRNARS